MKLPQIILILVALAARFHGYSQPQDSILLVRWNAMDCDNSLDPYVLRSHIGSMEYSGDETSIVVNFPENCCVKFQPAIEFSNDTLNLLPYTKRSNERCTCDCCFSIEYVISGLKNDNLKILFAGKRVEPTENYYDTVAPTFEVFEGKIINRENKFGFKEGTWITFYEDSSIHQIMEFPEQSLNFHSHRPIWLKSFYPGGALKSYDRYHPVHMQEWFEDGTLKYENYEYEVNDTTIEYTFSLHENKMLKEKSHRKKYTTTLTSEFNDCFEAEITQWKYDPRETYYENGQRESLTTSTSSNSWYPNGQVQHSNQNGRSTTYDSLGRVTKRTFYWHTAGLECGRDIENSLTIRYDQEENVHEVAFKREKLETYGHVTFSWTWDEKGTLIASPEKWDEELPWKRFEDLTIPKVRKRLKRKSN